MRILKTLGGSALAAFAALTMLTGWSFIGPQDPLLGERLWHAGALYGQNQLTQRLHQGGVRDVRPVAPVLPRVTRSFMSPSAVGKPLIFVSDSEATVNIYLQAAKHKLVGWITGLSDPEDLATDRAGNLYITLGGGFSGSPAVLVYAPPYSNGPMLSLQTGYPFGVAVSPQGIVAVTGCTSPSCGNQGVIFYPAGSAVPCAAVVPNPPVYLGYDAFDDKGKLYFDASNASNSGLIGEVEGGCNATSAIPLTTGNTIGFAGSIQVDKADRIAIMDASSYAVIDTYLRPKNGSLGNPVSTTPLANSPSAFPFAFTKSGRGIWVGDSVSGRASSYDYPTGGASEQTIIGGGYPYGIAVTPPLLP